MTSLSHILGFMTAWLPRYWLLVLAGLCFLRAGWHVYMICLNRKNGG
jgi:hypothetical protein